MSMESKNDFIDLGSDDAEIFDPFAEDDDLAEDESPAEDVAENDAEDAGDSDDMDDEPAQPPIAAPAASATPAQKQAKKATASTTPNDDANNPLANAIGAAETKDAEKAKQSIYEKLPVFEYAGATENIEDSSQTFDELRIVKAVDFPELDDGKRVSWSVEYGKITKAVTDAKGTSIGKMKTDIEQSKEFLDALKKAKDKNPICKIKPRVTAQSKGAESAPTPGNSGYKGVFTNMDEVDAAGKVISILPARDGLVYEIRNTPIGRFTTPVVGCEMLSDVKAGYTPALGIPRIPVDMVMRIIAFFQYFTRTAGDKEALVNIYWDKVSGAFVVDTPEQIVSRVSVDSNVNPNYQDERYIHFMDIHSHNSMRAYFSPTDDADEKATRLYTVMGRLDQYFPEIKTRISNGGKFHEIDPAEVFELITLPFPDAWRNKVKFRDVHDNDDCGDNGDFDNHDNHKGGCVHNCGNLLRYMYNPGDGACL